MSKARKSTGNLALQGGILAATSLFVRLIGFFYRVPLVNMLGEEGMGYYSSSFEIYSYVLVISTYALPSALSKIISNKLTLKHYKEAHQIFKAALLLGLLMGAVTSGILFFQAENIAALVGSTGSIYAIKALAPSLLIFSILAVFRGYFQGHNTMVPTAISQIVEQVFNAIFSLSLAYILLKQSLTYGAAGGTLGTGIGAFFGLLFIVFVYRMARPKFKKQMQKDMVSNEVPGLFTTWQIIFMTAAPMLIGSSVYNLSNLVDMVLFQRGLLYQGYEEQFVSAQYGILSSKYRLILTLPISIASALAAASIPSISASLALKEYTVVKNKAAMAIKTVLMISIPSAYGLGVLAKPILLMLFGSTSIEIASLLMRIGAVSVVFFSMSGISIGILQGLGLMKVPMRHSLIAIVIKIAMMVLLIYVFDTGLIGAVIANVLFSVIVAGTNYYSIQKEIKLKLNYREVLVYPLIAGLVMSIVALAVYVIIMSIGNMNDIATMSAIIAALPTYFIVLLKLGGIHDSDFLMLPMGKKLLSIIKRLKLM